LNPWWVPLAGAAHVAEEVAAGWVVWARRRVPGVTTAQFATVNAAFLGLACLAADQAPAHPFLFFAMSAVLPANAAVHLGAAALDRGYAPGLVTAVFLYIPLGWAVFLGPGARPLAAGFRWEAFAVGFAISATPFLFQLLRLRLGGR